MRRRLAERAPLPGLPHLVGAGEAAVGGAVAMPRKALGRRRGGPAGVGRLTPGTGRLVLIS